tara:strand:+ start:218 stop:610 length:393 start_codon:yes stop_codon:yes gene_type:complete
MSKFKIISSVFLVSILIYSCRKVEGPGGSVTIKGIVVERNHVGNAVFEYPAADQDVYLIYGNENSFYDDDIKTSFDGSFEFRYLQKGDYQVFVYEEDNAEPSGTSEILIPINASENNQIITLDTIYINNF